MELELKFWNVVAVAAIIILGWFVKRLIDNLDKRMDSQDEKLDKIILKQEIQDKQLLAHSIVLRKNFPDYLVNYPE